MNKLSTNCLKLFAFLSFLTFYLGAIAQSPTYGPTVFGTGANTIPFNTTNGYRHQTLYLAGEFSNNPAGDKYINKIYVRTSTVSNNVTYNNFEVGIGQSSIISLTTASWHPVSTVFSANTFSPATTTTGGWLAITLDTPFYYDPSLSLVIDFKFSSKTGTGFSVYSNTTVTGNRRSYSTTSTAVVPTSANASRFDIGFDLVNIPKGVNNARVMEITEPKLFCAGSHDIKVKVGNKGTNVINNLSIQWELDNIMQSPISLFNVVIDTLGSPNGSSDTVLTLGNALFGSSARNIRVWTEYPNFVADTINSDDTLNTPIKSSLNGTYTIGGTSPDYANFATAVNDLQTYGVCGPVIFNVASGTYTGQVEINEIPGSSVINTITFDGGNAANTTLTYSSSLTGSRHTVLLNGTDYIRFRNFTIQSTGAFGWPMHMLGLANNPVVDVKVSKCIIDVAGTAPTLTTNNFGGIIINGSTTSPTTGGRADSVIVDSNVINYGYYGIACIGLSGNQSTGNHFTNNVINYPSYNGIWTTYQNGVNIEGNTITGRPAGTTYSIYINNCNPSGSSQNSVQRNKITNINNYGIGFLSCTNAGTPGIIANNMIGGSFAGASSTGMYFTSTSNWNVYHNSINNNSTGGACINMLATATGMDVRNNALAVSDPLSLGFPLTIANPALSITQLNHNIYYKADTTGGLIKTDTTLFPFNFKGYAGFDNNSRFTDPGFTNDSLLMLKSACLNGTNLGITTDVNGNARNTPPDIGCFEAVALANDLSLDAIVSPKFPMASGNNDVTVRLRNVGNNTVTFAYLTYEFNGIPTQVVWGGSMGPCDTVSYTFPLPVNITGTIEPLKIYVASPNGFVDPSRVNDTILIKVGTPLHGIYTIGGSSPDFATINDAVSGIQSAGMSDSVIFNIRSGIYNEQALVNGIPGISSANYLVFQSEAGHADSVNVRYNALSATDNYVFKLFNISDVKIRNITITGLGSAFARGVEMSGSSSGIHVENSKVIIPGSALTTTNMVGIIGENLTGADISILNNNITGGNYNIFIGAGSGKSEDIKGGGASTPSKNVLIDNNTLSNAGYMGISLSGIQNLMLKRNDVTTILPISTSGYTGMNLSACDSSAYILNNKIILQGLTGNIYGLRLSSSSETASSFGLLANNAVSVSTTGNCYTAYIVNNRNWEYYNNSFNSFSTGATNYGLYTSFTATYPNNTYRNNIISNRGLTGYALYIQDPAFVSSEYNLLYTASANLVRKGAATATDYATLALYQAAYATQENQSFEYRVPFVSNTNLDINTNDSACWLLNGRGIHTGNNTDINGNVRSTSIINGACDIGAYEFTPSVPALLTTAVPATPTAGTTQAFLLFGDTIAKITWSPFFTPPVSIGVRFFGGEYAPQTNASHYRTNCYWDIEETGSGYYLYDIDLYYKETMKGSVTTEADMRLAKMHGTNPWSTFTGISSSADVVRNILSAQSLQDFSIFTGTDNTNPLPVKLSSFTASKTGADVKVNWTTASERNVSHFVVEASADGRTFVTIGKMPAKGNSSTSNFYTLMHNDAQRAMNGAAAIYYRLTSVDRDGSKETSRSVRVSFAERGLAATTVYPNPFVDGLVLNVSAETATAATIEVSGLGGELIITSLSKQLAAGTNEVELSELNNLKAGIYFIKISTNGENKVIKVVKQ